MKQQWRCLRLLALGLTIACMASQGHAQKKITVRVLDGRSGEKITPNNIEVHVNHQLANHIEFVKMNDDGTAELTLPENATAFALRATYASSMDYYVNCDVSRQKDTSVESWFPVDDVLKGGVVMPDECRKSKGVQPAPAKPGELVLYVRRRGVRDPVPYSMPY
jgi:hypothetical protein